MLDTNNGPRPLLKKTAQDLGEFLFLRSGTINVSRVH